VLAGKDSVTIRALGKSLLLPVPHVRLLVCLISGEVAQLTRTETILKITELTRRFDQSTEKCSRSDTTQLQHYAPGEQRLHRVQFVEAAAKW
jgi:hypothetical protein